MSAEKAEEDGVDNAEDTARVLLTRLLAGVYHRHVVEIALAALEAGLAISVVGIYRPTHHSPFHF